MMANGINLGWTSPSIILLTSDESPLPTGQITIGEVSWIASLVFAGSLMGGIFWGFIANIYGRKKPLILSSVPTVVRQNLSTHLHKTQLSHFFFIVILLFNTNQLIIFRSVGYLF